LLSNRVLTGGQSLAQVTKATLALRRRAPTRIQGRGNLVNLLGLGANLLLLGRYRL
jgi:hypothetical protein